MRPIHEGDGDAAIAMMLRRWVVEDCYRGMFEWRVAPSGRSLVRVLAWLEREGVA